MKIVKVFTAVILCALFTAVQAQNNTLPLSSEKTLIQNPVDASSSLTDKLKLQDELRIAIETVESQSGPFDSGLTEPLLALADLLTERGDHTEALQHYARLLHINRINRGLYHQSQFLIIDKIIDGNIAVQDWNAADDSQDFKYFVSQQLNSDNAQDLIDSINEHMDWKLAYIGVDPSKDKSKQLLQLDDLSEQVLEIASEGEEITPIQKASLHYHRSLINYYFSVSEDHANLTGKKLIGAGPVPSSELARLDHNPATQQYVRELQENNVYENQQIVKVVKRRVGQGKRELEKMITFFQGESNLEAEALSRIYLADWMLLSGKRKSAQQNYQQAFNQLVEAGIEAERVNKIYFKPAPLPVKRPYFTFDSLERAYLDSASSALENLSSQSEHISLGNYYSWSEAIPGVEFPRAISNTSTEKQAIDHLLVQFDINSRTKRMATRANASFSSRQRGRGNLENISVVEEQTLSDRQRRDAIDDIELLMFRPQLVDGKIMNAKNFRMKYFIATDQ